jgi:hypothetical protein
MNEILMDFEIRAWKMGYDAAKAELAEPVDLDQQVRDITAGVGLPPVESPVVPDPVIDCDCGQRWCWTDDAGWNPKLDKQAEPVVSVTWSEVVRQQAAFCDRHCTWLDHASDCPIGNPSF